MPAIQNAKGSISMVPTWTNFIRKFIQDLNSRILANFLCIAGMARSYFMNPLFAVPVSA
mgnify:CR=1 FL=1